MNKITDCNTHNISEVLGNLLRKHNMKSKDLSEQTKVPTMTIIRLLKNRNANPTLATLLPIAKYFKITINELCGT